MVAKKLGKQEAKMMLTDMFEELSRDKGKKVADKFLLGSGELAERLADGETGGNAKQFFSGVGKGLLGSGTGGVKVAGGGGCGRGGVKVAGGKDKKAGKIAGKILSLGLGKKAKAGDPRKKRGQIVAAIMDEKNMSLGQASHYVKKQGLWQ